MNVSVVIPCYNAESTIQATITSILPQLTLNDEIICVNDASTDSTGIIIQENNVIKIFSHQNEGVAKSIKKGYDHAKNNIICIIDADSIAPQNWIKTIKLTHEIPNTIIACGTYRSINDKTRNTYLDFISKHTKKPNGSGTNMSINKTFAKEIGLMKDLPKYSWDKLVQERAQASKYNKVFYDCPVLTHTPTSLISIAKQSFRYGRGRTSRGNLKLTFLIKRLTELIIRPFITLFFIHKPLLFKALWIEYYRTIIHTGGLAYGIITRL